MKIFVSLLVAVVTFQCASASPCGGGGSSGGEGSLDLDLDGLISGLLTGVDLGEISNILLNITESVTAKAIVGILKILGGCSTGAAGGLGDLAGKLLAVVNDLGSVNSSEGCARDILKVLDLNGIFEYITRVVGSLTTILDPASLDIVVGIYAQVKVLLSKLIGAAGEVNAASQNKLETNVTTLATDITVALNLTAIVVKTATDALAAAPKVVQQLVLQGTAILMLTLDITLLVTQIVISIIIVAVKNVIEVVWQAVATLLATIEAAIQVVTQVAGQITAVVAGVVTTVTNVTATVSPFVEFVESSTGVVGQVSGLADNITKSVKKTVTDLGGVVTGLLRGVLTTADVGGILAGLNVEAILDGHLGSVTEIVSGLTGSAKKIGGGLIGIINRGSLGGKEGIEEECDCRKGSKYVPTKINIKEKTKMHKDKSYHKN